MRVKTTVKAGHGPGTAAGRTVKTRVKAGAINHNHNETAVQARELKVQTGVKAGSIVSPRRTVVEEVLRVKTGVRAGTTLIDY